MAAAPKAPELELVPLIGREQDAHNNIGRLLASLDCDDLPRGTPQALENLANLALDKANHNAFMQSNGIVILLRIFRQAVKKTVKSKEDPCLRPVLEILCALLTKKEDFQSASNWQSEAIPSGGTMALSAVAILLGGCPVFAPLLFWGVKNITMRFDDILKISIPELLKKLQDPRVTFSEEVRNLAQKLEINLDLVVVSEAVEIPTGVACGVDRDDGVEFWGRLSKLSLPAGGPASAPPVSVAAGGPGLVWIRPVPIAEIDRRDLALVFPPVPTDALTALPLPGKTSVLALES